MRYIYLIGIYLLTTTTLNAQTKNDTIQHKTYLADVTVVGKDSRNDIHHVAEIVGTHIYAGKKNAVVVVGNVNGNIVTNNMRQILAKVPGIHIWESDGSGIQIGIATRGLSPNRSWDFNVRQNGIDIAADPFGYPEAYYHPPMQAVQRIHIVKGAGSLQFGPQLGGMVNYIVKNGESITKPFEIESQQTAGSNGLINTFNAIGGKTAKLNYYAFFDHRNADGWRENSQYKTNTGFATYSYQLSKKLKAGIELTTYSMLSQQPGGLTDSLFNINSQKSFRNRNWMNINWQMAAFTTNYTINEKQQLEAKIFWMAGDRNSVGFLQPITIKDSVQLGILKQAARSVDIDKYRNGGAEIRYLNSYSIGKIKNTFTAGLRYFKGNTRRYRNGTGTSDAGFDLSINGVFPSALDFNTNNLAVSVENVVRINNKLIIIPGARWESVNGTASGRLSFAASGSENKINNEQRKRNFLLIGVGAEYHITNSVEFYANYTQSYRPIQFADLSVNPTTEIVDSELKDAKGYNVDLGVRGKIKNFLFFDASIYHLQYNNRIGLITQLRPDLTSYNLRTNVGNSYAQGIEAILEFNPVRAFSGSQRFGEFNCFFSYAYNNARYQQLRVITKNSANQLVESNLKNQYVENAPEHILRAGLNYFYRKLTLTLQVSHVSNAFADANNTAKASATATNGLIPAYTVADAGITLKVNQQVHLRAGLNNLTNLNYFTRRAGGYPGPGLMPSDGRNGYLSIGFRL